MFTLKFLFISLVQSRSKSFDITNNDSLSVKESKKVIDSHSMITNNSNISRNSTLSKMTNLNSSYERKRRHKVFFECRSDAVNNKELNLFKQVNSFKIKKCLDVYKIKNSFV